MIGGEAESLGALQGFISRGGRNVMSPKGPLQITEICKRGGQILTSSIRLP